MNTRPGYKPVIAAPVDEPAEVSLLAKSGAGEVYCGFLPRQWRERYSGYDSLSRRQGTSANVTVLENLRMVALEAKKAGVSSALALNVRYSQEMLPEVLEYAEAWEQAGGQALLVSDLGLLLALQEKQPRLNRFLSLMAAAFNSRAVGFYRQFGISRVVLPRSLTIQEMHYIVNLHEDIEFEAMVLNDKCPYIDGLCSFYHGMAFPEGIRIPFEYQRAASEQKPVTYAHDLSYAGHACQLKFKSEKDTINPDWKNDWHRPHCAACCLRKLASAGINHWKIGGRGLPTEVKIKAVKFIKDAWYLAVDSPTDGIPCREIKDLYNDTYGRQCSCELCYYPGDRIVEV
ncbi:MAG: U32 family peptidase [Syntrophomonadaceae bacterium]